MFQANRKKYFRMPSAQATVIHRKTPPTTKINFRGLILIFQNITKWKGPQTDGLDKFKKCKALDKKIDQQQNKYLM